MPVWLNLPNLLTAARVALIPPIVMAIAAGEHVQALVVFLVAGFTDLFDGMAARRLGVSTRVGAYFDPIADKCLLVAVFLALAAARIIPAWFVALAIARDVAILAGAGAIMLATPLRKFPPSQWGKLSTFFQISAAMTWMVRNAWPGVGQDAAAQLALWLSAGFTLVSGLDYVRRAAGMLRANSARSSRPV
jgi:cardiolipin synthase (CMP-forming)